MLIKVTFSANLTEKLYKLGWGLEGGWGFLEGGGGGLRGAGFFFGGGCGVGWGAMHRAHTKQLKINLFI